jgi:hypothetical protein
MQRVQLYCVKAKSNTWAQSEQPKNRWKCVKTWISYPSPATMTKLLAVILLIKEETLSSSCIPRLDDWDSDENQHPSPFGLEKFDIPTMPLGEGHDKGS